MQTERCLPPKRGGFSGKEGGSAVCGKVPDYFVPVSAAGKGHALEIRVSQQLLLRGEGSE